MRLSKDEIKNEIRKCGSDPIYFLKNYVRITHPIKGLIPFTTYDYQDDLLKDFGDHRFNIILKSRQLGISTIVAGYAAWLMLFRREKQVLVVATKLKTAVNLVTKVKKMIKSVPDWLRISEIIVDNQTAFELQNGSKIQASTTSQNDAGRSESLSLLIVDEAAHVEHMSELWTSVKPTISLGGRCIALSSPNGVGNWFYKTYVDAQSGKNSFNSVILPWDVHPDRDQAWFLNEIKNMDRKEIAQEYECFTSESKIITPFGFAHIKDLKIGDKVLTHKGRYKKVLRTFNKKVETKNLIEISMPLSRKNKIIGTKEHPILTGIQAFKESKNIFDEIKIDSFKEEWMSYENIRDKFPQDVNSRSTPKYVNSVFPKLSDNVFLDKINKFDLSLFHIAKEISNNSIRYFRQKGHNSRFIELDYNTGRLIGLFLAEGFTDGKQTVFSFNSEETELISFVENWALTYNMRVRKNVRNYSKCTTVHITNQFLPLFLKDFINGNSCHNKILSDKIYDCSKIFAKGIVDGIWQGDGLHIPDKKNILGLVNEHLIYQIRTLMTAFNLITRVSFVEQKGHFKNDDKIYKRYYLELNNVDSKQIEDCTKNGIEYKPGQRTKFAKNKWWGRIKFEEFKTTEEYTDVYNIEVEDDNSYVVENLIVHNCSFNMSGETVIDPSDMARLKAACIPPLNKTGPDRNLWIWEEPIGGHSYMVIADVARGDGKDFSTFHVLDLFTMEQVAEYQGKANSDIFAMLLNSTGREYGNALIIVENASYGFNTLDKLMALEYPNLYWSVKSTHDFIDQIDAESNSAAIPGFSTTVKTRPLIIAKMEEFIRNKILKLNSERLFHEFETFVWNHGKPEALRGYNDDLVMALAIGCWVRDTALTSNKREVAYTKAILSAMVKSNTQMDTKIRGQQGYSEKNSIDPMKSDIQHSRSLHNWFYKG